MKRFVPQSLCSLFTFFNSYILKLKVIHSSSLYSILFHYTLPLSPSSWPLHSDPSVLLHSTIFTFNNRIIESTLPLLLYSNSWLIVFHFTFLYHFFSHFLSMRKRMYLRRDSLTIYLPWQCWLKSRVNIGTSLSRPCALLSAGLSLCSDCSAMLSTSFSRIKRCNIDLITLNSYDVQRMMSRVFWFRTALRFFEINRLCLIT